LSPNSTYYVVKWMHRSVYFTFPSSLCLKCIARQIMPAFRGERIMKMLKQTIGIVAVIFAISGCATIPSGPSVAVYPSPGKPFDQFQRKS